MKKKVEPDSALCFDGLIKIKEQGVNHDSTKKKERWEGEICQVISHSVLGGKGKKYPLLISFPSRCI